MLKRELIFFACVLLLLSSCGGQKRGEVTPTRVRAEVVSTDFNVTTDSYVGLVEAGTTAVVSFPAPGILAKVAVSEGDRVSKGALIAELDKRQASNMLSAAQAQWREAQDVERRMKSLYEQGSIPEMKWVEIESKVDQARAQLDIAKKSLENCSIYAPASGVIGRDVASVGETVLPAMPVATLLGIAKVKIKVSIPEKEISRIAADTPTAISVEALGGRSFQGGSIEKGVQANRITHTYDIYINTENPDYALLPGMICNVKIARGVSESNAVTVPITSVQRSATGDYFVWVIESCVVSRRAVKTGAAFGNRIEIPEGLDSGEQIVTDGYQKLSEGTAVVVVE